MNALLKAKEIMEGSSPPEDLKKAFSEYQEARTAFSKIRIQAEKALADIYEKKTNVIKIVEKINAEQSPSAGA